MKLKDPVSGALHLTGLVLSIAGLVLLVIIGRDSVWKIVSGAIYGGTLVLLYNFSTLYHWLPASAGGKSQLFRKLDHLSIYLLIAGTYTPFCLVTLRGPWGWSLFSVIWGFALLGIAIQSFHIDLDRRLTTLIYVGMGWLVVFALQPLAAAIPWNGIILLVAGGVFYSIGGVIYALKRPNLFKFYGFHELWHTFVLLGSFCHFLAVFFYVAQ